MYIYVHKYKPLKLENATTGKNYSLKKAQRLLYHCSLLLEKEKLSSPIIVLRNVLCYVVMMEKLLISGDK